MPQNHSCTHCSRVNRNSTQTLHIENLRPEYRRPVGKQWYKFTAPDVFLVLSFFLSLSTSIAFRTNCNDCSLLDFADVLKHYLHINMSSSQNQVRIDQQRLYSESISRVKLTMPCLQNDNVFYFGGPLLGINDPTLRGNSEILTNSDGTRVAFSVDPRPSASRSPGASIETGGEGPLTAADLDHDFRDARNPFDDAETGFQNTEESGDEEVEGSVVSFSFFHPTPQSLNTTFQYPHNNHSIPHSHTHPTPITQFFTPHLHTQAYSKDYFNMANGENNWKLHLLADLAFIFFAPERLQQANATAQQQADATTQQQADATAPQPSSPESSSGDDDDESSAQAPPSQGSTAVTATATPGKFTSKQPTPTILTIYQRPRDKVSRRQPGRKEPDAPPDSIETPVKAC